MSLDPINSGRSPLATLRQLARRPVPVESCELCRLALGHAHQHLIELANHKLICACDACAILFSNQSAVRYRRVPKRRRRLKDFSLSAAQWHGLMIPIELAFFFHSSRDNRVKAIYPSPGGPMESLLVLEYWTEIVNGQAQLSALEMDVEALLVNRIGQAGNYLIVPIDDCYRLVGLIRTHWHGLSGGKQVWDESEAFFAAVTAQAEIV